LADLPVVVNRAPLESSIDFVALETRKSNDNATPDIGLVVEASQDRWKTSFVTNCAESSHRSFSASRISVVRSNVAQRCKARDGSTFTEGPTRCIDDQGLIASKLVDDGDDEGGLHPTAFD